MSYFVNKNNILQTPIEYLKGVGPYKADILKKELKIFVFEDLLQCYPYRYIDRSNFVKINEVQEDGTFVQMIGKITYTEIVGVGRARRLVAQFKDQTGMAELVWFQGIAWIEKIIGAGGEFLVFGKMTRFNGYWNISHPEIEKLESTSVQQLPNYIPVYSATEKLRNNGLAGKAFVRLIQQLFSQLHERDIVENLPENIRQNENLAGKFYALSNIHFPKDKSALQRATYRLKFEELFVHQIAICKLKLNQKAKQGYQFLRVGDYFNTFYSQHLPFELTDDQKTVLRQIRQDTQTGLHMNRLLQGDVGSGKTIVALLCMLLAMDNQFQACLMAPTEILAQQHFEGISKLLEGMDIQVGFLTGKIKVKERRILSQKIEEGDIQILIGTHALIEDKVSFKNLGLCIIDEQHRFGVAQRAKLWKKNHLPPHILVMTATPIPRTLAMTSYGDLDHSIITQLPPGRKPISTIHRSENFRAKVMDFIRTEIDLGRQAYIVYPLIAESEKLDYENLEAGYEQVKQFFPTHKYNIAMVHGKQDADERQSNMNAFVKGKAHIMVATTVIEVGVNVPNASVMLIESAERFGLAQLHQLRGRVGRGADKSYCILLTNPKLNPVAKERMHTMVTESSGFAISEKDLELRGPGDIDGLRQSGGADLKLADIIKDVQLMEHTRNIAIELLKQDPELIQDSQKHLRTYLLSKTHQQVWSQIS